MKKCSGIHTQIRITTKSQSLLEGRSPLAHICQVWSTSVSAFVSYPVYIFGSVCLSDLSQNVVDALSCRRQLFCQAWYKSAVDCMRNAKKCPKMPTPQCEENEKVSGIHIHTLPDHHQKSITSRGSFTCCPCLSSLVDVRIRVHQ